MAQRSHNWPELEFTSQLPDYKSLMLLHALNYKHSLGAFSCEGTINLAWAPLA